MAGLTTDEKIGQIVFPTYFGAFESVESKDFKELMARVQADNIGGFILGTRRGPRGIELSHVYETAVLTNELQEAAKIPLLIGADFERGTVMRVEEGTAFPHAMAVGATWRPGDAYAMGRITAIEARAMGVHWVFAPVADVNSNPDNPIINIRSFGEDPKQVAEYVEQFVRGVEENGAMATAKHFPGHGDTSVDSHLQLPLVTAGLERLNAVEFVPFEAAIGAGVSAVMTGHLAIPALEPNPEIPATLSERVLTGVLRDQLHFQGLVITDALDMGGVAKGFPPGEVAVRALLAGADVLLLSPVTDAALAAVREAVNSGRVPMSRLDDAVRRVLEAKARLGLYKQREVDIDKLSGAFGRPEFLATAEDIADRGVTLLRNDAGLVPLDPRTTKRVFLLAVSADPDTAPAEPFERELRAQLDSLTSLHVDTKYFRVEETPLPSPDSYDLAICAVTVRIADRKGTVGLPANEAEMIHALLRAGKPVIMVGLGSPYLMESFPEATTWLAAFSVQDVAQRAAAQALLGTFAVRGKLPVSLPSAAPHALRVGDGMATAAIPLTLQQGSAGLEQRLKPVYELLDRSANRQPYLFGLLSISYKGERVMRRFGEQAYEASAPEELAQSTLRERTEAPGSQQLHETVPEQPVLVTALARLVQTKQIALESPVSRVLQGVPLDGVPEKGESLKVRELLERASEFDTGTPADEHIWREEEALILSTLTGQRPSFALEKLILSPLGLPNQDFRSARLLKKWDDLERYAEARAMLGQFWLNGGIYAHKRLLSRTTAEQFYAPKSTGWLVVAAGWDISHGPGHSFPPGSFGWTSSDSTSLWMDPAHDLCIVFVPLINSRSGVHGTEDDRLVGPLRGEVHDAVFSALGLQQAK